MTVLLVFLGGALGAPCRFLLDRAVQRRHDGVFPWGTLAVNVLGCFALGLLTGTASRFGLPRDAVLFAGTGLCGGFTTFSTFGYETARLAEEGSMMEAGLNVVGSLALGLLAAVAGFALAGV